MPVVAYETALPPLLAAGVLSCGKIEALLNFCVNAKSFNLALELAQGSIEKDSALRREASRARLKAGNFIEVGRA